MLLFSSATRIVYTKRPPAPAGPPQAKNASTLLVTPGWRRVNTNGRPCVALRQQESRAGNYQGMIFRSPFFFLLEDSFFGSSFFARALLGSAVVPGLFSGAVAPTFDGFSVPGGG